jgi:hypothetical protein
MASPPLWHKRMPKRVEGNFFDFIYDSVDLLV